MSVEYSSDCLVTWSAILYRNEQGSQVYGTLLEEFSKSYGDTVNNEHCVSSADSRQMVSRRGPYRF